MFYYLSIKDAEKDQRDWAEKMLGVLLTPEQIHGFAGSNKGKDGSRKIEPLEEVYIPLLAQLKGKEYYVELAKTVVLPDGTKMGQPHVIGMGDYKKEKDEEIIPLSNSPKGEFMRMMKETGVFDPEAMEYMDKKRKEVEEDPERKIEVEMKLREKEKDLTQTSKDEHIRKMQQALGTAPLSSLDDDGEE